jgi:hypothetical protein
VRPPLMTGQANETSEKGPSAPVQRGSERVCDLYKQRP